MNLYQQELLDHYHNPRNKGELDSADIVSNQYNPACGDTISIQANLDADTLTTIAFKGSGCVISQAAASMVTQVCINKRMADVITFDSGFVTDLIGISLGPTRLKCALLPLHALQEGIRSYQNKRKSADVGSIKTHS